MIVPEDFSLIDGIIDEIAGALGRPRNSLFMSDLRDLLCDEAVNLLCSKGPTVAGMPARPAAVAARLRHRAWRHASQLQARAARQVSLSDLQTADQQTPRTPPLLADCGRLMSVAIMVLTPTQRAAVLLKHSANGSRALNYSELAILLGLPSRKAASRLYRTALEQLRSAVYATA